MGRILFFLKITLLSTIILWFMLNPGTVVMTWLGYHYEAPVGLVIAGILGLSALGMFLLQGIAFLKSIPSKFKTWQQKKKEKRAYNSFTEGLAALSMNDLATAQQKALETQMLLHDSPLPLILAAQTAEKAKDYPASTRAYGLLLKDKKTEFLGFYGLTCVSMNERDYEAAYLYATKAMVLEKKSLWALKILFEVNLRLNSFDEALKILKQRKSLEKDHKIFEHYLSMTLYLKAMHEGFQKKKLFLKAFEADSSFVPCSLELSKFFQQEKSYKKAEKILEKAISIFPHPHLLNLYINLKDDFTAAQKVQRAEKIVEWTRSHYEGHMILSEEALKGGFTGIARTHLDLAMLAKGPSSKIKALSLELQSITADGYTMKSQDLVERHNFVEKESSWKCKSCHESFDVWTLICGHCGQFDSIDWQ